MRSVVRDLLDTAVDKIGMPSTVNYVVETQVILSVLLRDVDLVRIAVVSQLDEIRSDAVAGSFK
jgi:hypothetical protein